MGRQLAELRETAWETCSPKVAPLTPSPEEEDCAAKRRRWKEARRQGLRLLTVCGRWRKGGRIADRTAHRQVAGGGRDRVGAGGGGPGGGREADHPGGSGAHEPPQDSDRLRREAGRGAEDPFGARGPHPEPSKRLGPTHSFHCSASKAQRSWSRHLPPTLRYLGENPSLRKPSDRMRPSDLSFPDCTLASTLCSFSFLKAERSKSLNPSFMKPRPEYRTCP